MTVHKPGRRKLKRIIYKAHGRFVYTPKNLWELSREARDRFGDLVDIELRATEIIERKVYDDALVLCVFGPQAASVTPMMARAAGYEVDRGAVQPRTKEVPAQVPGCDAMVVWLGAEELKALTPWGAHCRATAKLKGYQEMAAADTAAVIFNAANADTNIDATVTEESHNG